MLFDEGLQGTLIMLLCGKRCRNITGGMRGQMTLEHP